MGTAIEFDHVGKLYRLGTITTGTLRQDLQRWWAVNIRHREDPWLKVGETNDRSTRGTSDWVWALRDISFQVEQGDVVGIVGKNGAGKSTLLKILSRITTPTTGTIRARGRIGSLLEVGTGFHPELTGRDNIYMNGAILGMRKDEIRRKLDAIVDFSGCERYIDTPVKRYSSGMLVRLGFAVAAHLDPEILVVDEVLAVGDAEFQKKAVGKMQEVSHSEGRTVLFVSHNMTAVRNLCKSGVILHDGRISFSGGIEAVVSQYLENQNKRSEISISDIRERQGNGILRFNNLAFRNGCGVEQTIFEVGSEMQIDVAYETRPGVTSAGRSQINVVFKDMMGNKVCWISTLMYRDNVDFAAGHVTFHIPQLTLSEGCYTFNLYCEIDGILADWVQDVGRLEVVFQDYYGHGRRIPEGQGPLVMPFDIAG